MDFSCYFINPKISLVLLVAPFLIRTDCSFFDVYIKYLCHIQRGSGCKCVTALRTCGILSAIETWNTRILYLFFLDHMNDLRGVTCFYNQDFCCKYILSMWGNTKKQRRQIWDFFTMLLLIIRNIFLEFSRV